MPILPLAQFEADATEHQIARDVARSAVPETIVVRFGRMGLIGEYPYDGSARPGCGSKLVIRTHRGVELGTLLTSTCPNAGCGSSVTRKQMLDYFDRSGGRDYPFFSNGRVVRIAEPHDVMRQERLDADRPRLRVRAAELAREHNLEMEIVDAEPLLGGERTIIYFTSEQRVDFRTVLMPMRDMAGTRVELHHVGARDEARLVGDYERCGQQCCCKNFLKVLKPVSMKSAKIQKATLDPLKISGRCGRLMCCLRYEDQTYAELRKRLPHRKTQVGTPEGDGIVIRTQILTQLVLVRLDADRRDIAVPVEELTEPGLVPMPKPKPEPPEGSAPSGEDDRSRRRRRRRKPAEKRASVDGPGAAPAADQTESAQASGQPEAPARKRRRRRRKRSGGSDEAGSAAGASAAQPKPHDPATPGAETSSGDQPERKRRRKRRRKGGNGGGSAPANRPADE